MKNKYLFRSHVSEKKFREILNLFCVDIDASKTSLLTGVIRLCENRIFDKIREFISIDCENVSPFESGKIELDEIYFGARIVRCKRGIGAMNTPHVFGMLKRNGKVYTQIVKHCSFLEILPIIESKTTKDTTIYTDCFKTYDGLADFGYKRHYRIKHTDNEFANGHNHINGI